MGNTNCHFQELPYLVINLGPLQIPYGAVSFSNGMMLGMAQAQGINLSGLEMTVGLTSISLLAAIRAGIGTTRDNPLATIINYNDPSQQLPATEEEWEKYHSSENILKRSSRVGLRYQIEALLGYGIGYLYGKMGQ